MITIRPKKIVRVNSGGLIANLRQAEQKNPLTTSASRAPGSPSFFCRRIKKIQELFERSSVKRVRCLFADVLYSPPQSRCACIQLEHHLAQGSLNLVFICARA